MVRRSCTIKNSKYWKEKILIPSQKPSHKIIIFQDKGYRIRDIIGALIFSPNPKKYIEIFPGICVKIIRILFWEYIIFCGYNNVDRFEIVDDVESVRESSGGRYNATIDEFVYPEMLGGGKCGGCPLYTLYQHQCTLNYSNIFIISLEQLLNQTTALPFFIDKCKRHKCYENYLSIQEHGFDMSRSNETLTGRLCDGKILVDEGKHRICAMKRFGYNKEVTVALSKKIYPNWELCRTCYDKLKNDLEKYYDKLKNLNISKEDARAGLMDGTLHNMIIDKLQEKLKGRCVITDYFEVITPEKMVVEDKISFDKYGKASEERYRRFLEKDQPIINAYEKNQDMEGLIEDHEFYEHFRAFFDPDCWINVAKFSDNKYIVTTNGNHRMYVAQKYGLKLIVHVGEERNIPSDDYNR